MQTVSCALELANGSKFRFHASFDPSGEDNRTQFNFKVNLCSEGPQFVEGNARESKCTAISPVLRWDVAKSCAVVAVRIEDRSSSDGSPGVGEDE
jgi:hypothetical protein